jgi:hypothetical protein
LPAFSGPASEFVAAGAHDRLAKTVRRLRAMCAALEDGERNFLPEVLPNKVIGELRANLGEHFDAEESDAYFGTVLAEEPLLTAEIAGLKSEHEALLRASDMLCGFAKDRNHWPQLPGPTHELMGAARPA